MGLLQAFNNSSLNQAVSYFFFVTYIMLPKCLRREAFKQLLHLEFTNFTQLNLDLKATDEPLVF